MKLRIIFPDNSEEEIEGVNNETDRVVYVQENRKTKEIIPYESIKKIIILQKENQELVYD